MIHVRKLLGESLQLSRKFVSVDLRCRNCHRKRLAVSSGPLYGGHMLALVIGKYRQRLLEDQFFNFTLRAKSLAHDDVNE